MKTIQELIQYLNNNGWQAKLIDQNKVSDYRPYTGALFDNQGLIESNWLCMEWELLKVLYDNNHLIPSDKALFIFL